MLSLVAFLRTWKHFCYTIIVANGLTFVVFVVAVIDHTGDKSISRYSGGDIAWFICNMVGIFFWPTLWLLGEKGSDGQRPISKLFKWMMGENPMPIVFLAFVGIFTVAAGLMIGDFDRGSWKLVSHNVGWGIIILGFGLLAAVFVLLWLSPSEDELKHRAEITDDCLS